jgi:predicted deacetylase
MSTPAEKPLGLKPADTGRPFDLWSLDEGRTLGEFVDLAHALAAVRRVCAQGPAELVLSHEEHGRRSAIAVGVEVLTLARVDGHQWSEAGFAHARRETALESVRQASTDFVARGNSESKLRLEAAARRLAKLGPPKS